MKFAKVVFGLAGVWGVLVFTPLYFLFDYIGRREPPALTHPQFYFGFVGLGLAWQAAFLVMAWDPRRFRPMMIPAVLEKWGYAATVIVLALEGRVSTQQLVTAMPDALWGLLFFIAFVKAKTADHKPEATRTDTAGTAPRSHF